MRITAASANTFRRLSNDQPISFAIMGLSSVDASAR
jgi:hypothetical protein